MSIRRFQLERYLAGEVQGEEREALERTLASEPEAQAMLDALKQEQSSFEAQVPYAAFRIEHEKRRDQKVSPRRWWMLLMSLGVASAAALMIASPSDPGSSGSETTRLKGDGVSLNVAVQNSSGVAEPQLAGAHVIPGAMLQMSYDAGSHGYGALFGIDGSGTVQQYWPSTQRMAALPSSKGGFPFALELDETPGRERFYAVFSHEALALQEIRELIESAGELEPQWPNGVEGAMSWVEKNR